MRFQSVKILPLMSVLEDNMEENGMEWNNNPDMEASTPPCTVGHSSARAGPDPTALSWHL